MPELFLLKYLVFCLKKLGRGRNAGHPAPPAQSPNMSRDIDTFGLVQSLSKI